MLKKILHRISSISHIKFYYQRSIREYSKREKISTKIADKIGKSKFDGISVIKESHKNELATKGYIDFGEVLNNQIVDSIKKSLLPLKCFDPFKPELGEFFEPETPDKVHVANFTRKDLVQIPEVLKIANDPKILNLVQDFLGATPTISNINCWWSTANKDEAEQAQFFHRDVDDYRFCKIFIYLTDVTIDSGPHVFVEDSPSTNTLTAIRRYKDEEIETEFGKNKVKYFVANKGSMFMVNTYGFHKGLLPKTGKRLLLQVQYSLQPIGIEKYSPVNVTNNSYDPYVNRLIIK